MRAAICRTADDNKKAGRRFLIRTTRAEDKPVSPTTGSAANLPFHGASGSVDSADDNLSTSGTHELFGL
jgi:hypothetical protein